MKKFNEFLDEAKDDGEYGQQGGMAKSQLRMIMSAAKRLHDSLKDDDVLPGHIIANIVLASDYVTGSADYMESEMDDEEYDDDEMDDMDEASILGPKGTIHKAASTDQSDREYTAQRSFKTSWKAKNTGKKWPGYEKAGFKSQYDFKEEVELAEEQKPAYHYYATKNGIGAKEMKLTHSKSKPFTSETDALKHIGRQNGIIHKVNSTTGKVVQHRGIDGGQKGYPTPASDMAGDAPKHVRDLKEEAANLRITKVYNKFPKKATYAVHTSDRKYYKEFDNEAAAKAHHAEKSGK